MNGESYKYVCSNKHYTLVEDERFIVSREIWRRDDDTLIFFYKKAGLHELV